MNGLASYEAIEKQDRYKKIDLEPEDIEKLKNDVEYWKREAIRMAAELGEMKMNLQALIDKYSSKKSNDNKEAIKHG